MPHGKSPIQNKSSYYLRGQKSSDADNIKIKRNNFFEEFVRLAKCMQETNILQVQKMRTTLRCKLSFCLFAFFFAPDASGLLIPQKNYFVNPFIVSCDFMKKDLVKEFKDKKELYDSFRERVVNLLEDLLLNSKIQFHQLNSRTKAFDSLSTKIAKKDKYTSLSEITDIVGIRIITYLESEVDNVEQLVRREFVIDEDNSIDKRLLQTNQFGYRSLHIVASLDESRLKLTEYRRYKNLKFEIQIRSILQHAWAEIEHDLGYKGKSSIPDSYVRSFNRMAALLESADIEFDRLKKELTKYEKEVPHLIEQNPEKVTINQASLDSLVKKDKTFESAREYVSSHCGAIFDKPSNYSDVIDRMELFKITNIKELQTLIDENSKDYINFIKEFIGDGISKNLSYHLPLYWFQHFLAGKTGDVDFVNKYMHYKGKNMTGKPREFIDIYNKIKNHS